MATNSWLGPQTQANLNGIADHLQTPYFPMPCFAECDSPRQVADSWTAAGEVNRSRCSQNQQAKKSAHLGCQMVAKPRWG
jgi:hypothetical protein